MSYKPNDLEMKPWVEPSNYNANLDNRSASNTNANADIFQQASYHLSHSQVPPLVVAAAAAASVVVAAAAAVAAIQAAVVAAVVAG